MTKHYIDNKTRNTKEKISIATECFSPSYLFYKSIEIIDQVGIPFICYILEESARRDQATTETTETGICFSLIDKPSE